jgi:hypothetical protein
MALILVLASVPTARTSPRTAGEILARAEAVRSPELDYAADFKLHVVAPDTSWKEREAEYTLIAHGKDESLILIREPEQFYPGTLLITHGRYWLLLPRSERPFQLSPRHVLNGDISNGDLARGNLEMFYEPRLDGEEEVRGEKCWRLELARTKNLGLYPRIRCWITKRHYRPWKFEYYGQTGALLKTAYYEDYREGPLGVRSMRILVENHARTGEHTTMTFSDLRPFEASKLTYTREALPAFRDAARSVQEAGGAHARPEELMPLLVTEAP